MQSPNHRTHLTAAKPTPTLKKSAPPKNRGVSSSGPNISNQRGSRATKTIENPKASSLRGALQQRGNLTNHMQQANRQHPRWQGVPTATAKPAAPTSFNRKNPNRNPKPTRTKQKQGCVILGLDPGIQSYKYRPQIPRLTSSTPNPKASSLRGAPLTLFNLILQTLISG